MQRFDDQVLISHGAFWIVWISVAIVAGLIVGSGPIGALVGLVIALFVATRVRFRG
jgi:hypothetical protein